MAGSQYFFNSQATSWPGGMGAPVALLGRGGAVRPVPDALEVLTTLDDVRAANRRALAGAKRLISIYTSDLEPKLYEFQPFLEVVQRFLLAHSFAKIRLLTQKSVSYTTPHLLAAMRRRLSGHIEVRCVAAAYAGRGHGMLIADNRHIVYRAQASGYSGVAGFDKPSAVRPHLAEFEEMWLASAPKY